MSVAQAVLWPVPGAQADIFGAWWVPVGADVAPSPQASRGAPLRASSGRSFGDRWRFIQAQTARKVAVLFARADSVYYDLDGVIDVYDAARDARTWPGGCPVVAHPPCRSWSRLRHMSKAPPGERELAVLAVELVRRWGGVLEHPSASVLWAELGLPAPGSTDRDAWGVWSLAVSQKWWGHRAEKATWLYVVGVEPRAVPVIPFAIHEAPRTLGLFSGRDRSRARPEVTKREREATPPAFARWLVDLASRCSAGAVTPAEVSRGRLRAPVASCRWCGARPCRCETLEDLLGEDFDLGLHQ